MATKIKLNQLENSTTAGSIAATNTSNVLTHVAPPAASVLWGYDHGETATVYVNIGTNLSYDAGTNTLNASAGAGGYADVLNDGSGFTNSNTNTKLNFVGSALQAADGGAGETDITIATILNTIATDGAVTLTTSVTGTLPVANGGTGAATLTGLLQGNGTSAVTAITNSSTPGQVLRVTGASTYAWGALDLSDTDAITGDLPYANLAQGSALSVLGVTGNATADNASIAAASDHQVLRRSGSAVAFGAINLAQSNAVTGILAIANGGTGSATQNFVDLTNTQSVGGNKTFTGNNIFSNNITMNGTPSALTDVITVGYFNNTIANGLKYHSVRAATTATQVITARTATTLTVGGTTYTVDGQTMANGEYVLIKNDTSGVGGAGSADNGAYLISGIGSSVLLTRATYMDAAGEIDAHTFVVEDGSTNVGTVWITTSEVTTLGTDAIVFTQLQTSGTVTGTGVNNQIAVWSGTNSQDGNTTFTWDQTQLTVGTATPVSNVRATIQGTGTSSATYGLQLNNSSAVSVFRVADNGTVTIGNGSDVSTIGIDPATSFNISTTNLNLILAAGGVVQMQGGGTSVTGPQVQIIGTKNMTSGVSYSQQYTTTFSPTSGTATYAGLHVNSTINQTGGANGITRGIYIQPTLTAVADYRALEITSSASHYALYTTAGKVRFDLGSDATGDVYYRGAGGEMTRLGIGSNGYVLTLAAGLPTWAAPAGGTKTVGYVTGTGTTTYDLDSGSIVKDVDGATFAFTVPTNLDLVDVYRNGVMLSRSGTVTRDYTIVSATGVLTLVTALGTDEELKIVKNV